MLLIPVPWNVKVIANLLSICNLLRDGLAQCSYVPSNRSLSVECHLKSHVIAFSQ